MSQLGAIEWNIPAAGQQILPNSVHIWKAEFQSFRQVQDLLASWLNVEETQRWQRYIAEDVRERFLTSRGLLRAIISFYTGRDPSEIQFAVSPHGKPNLCFPGQTGMEFSVSHSSGIILFAFTKGLPVGIDVETMRQELEHNMISSKYFSQLENQSILDLPQSLQKHAFFNCWTRKEAYLKGLGVGLQAPLQDFSVSVSPHEPAFLIDPLPADNDGDPWQIVAIEPQPGYAAAAAVRSIHKLDLFYWQASPQWLGSLFNTPNLNTPG